MYKDGLKPAVMETIYQCNTLPPSDNLNARMMTVHRVETQYKDFLYWKNQHHPAQNTQSKPTPKHCGIVFESLVRSSYFAQNQITVTETGYAISTKYY